MILGIFQKRKFLVAIQMKGNDGKLPNREH